MASDWDDIVLAEIRRLRELARDLLIALAGVLDSEGETGLRIARERAETLLQVHTERRQATRSGEADA